jgi:hypothetical protein
MKSGTKRNLNKLVFIYLAETCKQTSKQINLNGELTYCRKWHLDKMPKADLGRCAENI